MMSRIKSIWFSLSVALLMSLTVVKEAQHVYAGSVSLTVGGQTREIDVQSILDRGFLTIFRQKYDYSCGSAALATLLTFHYERRVASVDVFKTLYKQGDREKINQYGFSLLDMKRYLNSLGYEVEGVRMPLEQYIEVARVPAIVMIQTDGYKHFVVLKGYREGRVLIGDPAKGLRALTQTHFESIWQGLFFVITNEAKKGRRNFNQKSEWGLLASVPGHEVIDKTGLSEFTLMLPRNSDFF